MQTITQTGSRTGSRRTVRVLANMFMAGLVTSAAMLGIAGTAAAAPPDVACAQLYGPRGAATSYRYVTVYNTCTGPITIRLQIDNGPDSGCFRIERYDAEQLRYNRFIGTFRNVILDC